LKLSVSFLAKSQGFVIDVITNWLSKPILYSSSFALFEDLLILFGGAVGD